MKMKLGDHASKESTRRGFWLLEFSLLLDFWFCSSSQSVLMEVPSFILYTVSSHLLKPVSCFLPLLSARGCYQYHKKTAGERVDAGEYDLICNWLGNSRWVHAMEWSGQKNFVNSPEVPFVVDDTEAGVLKSYGPLSFLKVHDAGHIVPMDQPKAALTMLKRWTQGTLAEDAAEPEKLVAQM